MSIELYTNQLHQLTAELDDPKAADMVKLRSLTLNKNGLIIRTLNAQRSGSAWVCPFAFTGNDIAGDYDIRWQFSF